MASPSLSTLADFDRTILGDDCETPAEEHGLKQDIAIILPITKDGKASRVGIDRFCGHPGDATDTLQRQMQNHFLAHNNACDLVSFVPLSS